MKGPGGLRVQLQVVRSQHPGRVKTASDTLPYLALAGKPFLLRCCRQAAAALVILRSFYLAAE